MQNNYRSKAFKAWLDKLQQESWQLELIISGFAIYGLTQVFEPIKVYLNIASNEGHTAKIYVLIIAIVACSILIYTLLFHVILRGLWIGALGLRYVSGDIDYKTLNYRPKFDRYLRKKIGSFDKYISKLEDYCSVIFAISFLLIFYIISLIIIFSIFGVLVQSFSAESFRDNMLIKSIAIILLVFMTLGSLFTFIDFISQGYLKKNKWLAKIYFPFYWVFSYITLSFLYRPLVHNFLDNKFGKRISLILIPCYFLITIISSFGFNKSNYFSSSNDSNIYTAGTLNYDENILEEDQFIKNASIPSKIITTHYLPIFIAFDRYTEDAITNFNPYLKPKEDKRGYKSDIVTGYESASLKTTKDSLKIQYFKTLSKMYTFKIDSVAYKNLDFLYSKHNRNQDGFETVLPLKNIADGKHNLEVYRLKKTDSTQTQTQDTIITIPFWYYKN